MPESLLAELEGMRDRLAAIDPAVLSGDDCASVMTALAAVEKACEAAKVRTAARAAACGAHRTRGFGDAADWLARSSGTSLGDARAALDTVDGLAACPATAEAVNAGELSLAQAAEISRTEAARPGSEAELLDVARRHGLRGLRDRARRRRQEAMGADELHRRQHDARTVRHWRTDLGMVALAAELPPEVGIPLVNRLEAEADRRRREARQQLEPGQALERWDAYAADALAAMLAGHGRGRATTADLILVVDVRAWRRGHAHDGEVCHLLGGGPIPVELAKELSKDAFVKAVLHDGVALHTVAHFGRHIPAVLQTALVLGPVPELTGATCVEDGCDRNLGLERDHVDPVAHRGPTSYDNLDWRCWPHHRAKTERDRAAGLLDPPDRGPP